VRAAAASEYCEQPVAAVGTTSGVKAAIAPSSRISAKNRIPPHSADPPAGYERLLSGQTSPFVSAGSSGWRAPKGVIAISTSDRLWSVGGRKMHCSLQRIEGGAKRGLIRSM